MSAPPAPGSSAEALGEILPWLGVLALFAVAGAVAIWLLRRALRREPGAEGGFTLQELRDLRAKGALSDHEYERARAAVIGRLAAPQGDPRGDAPGAAQEQSR